MYAVYSGFTALVFSLCHCRFVLTVFAPFSFSSSVEQEQVQKRTFTNWINAQLSKVNVKKNVKLYKDVLDKGEVGISWHAGDTGVSVTIRHRCLVEHQQVDIFNIHSHDLCISQCRIHLHKDSTVCSRVHPCGPMNDLYTTVIYG